MKDLLSFIDMEIKTLKLSIELENNLSPADAGKIRGYLGNLFWDNPYAHQHSEDGKFIYKYPRVQYKIVKGKCILIGFNEGMQIVKQVFFELKSINISGRWQKILGKGLEGYCAFFSISSDQTSYSFLTPWLALNEKNFENYRELQTLEEKKKLLENILIGNIISISKSLGYTVPEPIEAHIQRIKQITTKLKNVPMIGFLGTFSVNFEIPDYWGIGKSVSRGFGTIKKLSNNLNRIGV